MQTIAAHIASLVTAIHNCEQSGNTEWKFRHSARLSAILQNFLPSGSGWDTGTTIDIGRSQGDKRLVFRGAYHHHGDHGYDRWTNHEVWVTPTFEGINIRVTGQNRNDIKDYLHELFHTALSQRVDRIAIDALMPLPSDPVQG
jgi:hypothetical protein